MTNLSFTLWMLLFPLSAALCAYVYEGKLKRGYTRKHWGLSAFLDMVTWLAVGWLLYGS